MTKSGNATAASANNTRFSGLGLRSAAALANISGAENNIRTPATAVGVRSAKSATPTTGQRPKQV